MLCAFSSYQQFSECVQRFNQKLHSFSASNEKPSEILSNIFVFRAFPSHSEESDQYQNEAENTELWDDTQNRLDVFPSRTSIYGFAVHKSKVQVLPEWKTVEDLRSTFPTLPANLVDSIWRQQNSWQSCFQILSSLLSTSDKLMLNDCDFLFEEDQWPPLSSLRDRQSSLSSEGSNHDWTIVKMQSYLENPQCLQDWELLKDALPSAEHQMEKKNSRAMSYREALLTVAPQSETPTAVPTAPRTERINDWKATIIVGPKVPAVRKDRRYVNSKLSMAERLGLPADTILSEEEISYWMAVQEEEDEFDWDICCNGKLAAQSSVTLKRKADLTHLRPNSYDQKMKRLAMKMK